MRNRTTMVIAHRLSTVKVTPLQFGLLYLSRPSCFLFFSLSFFLSLFSHLIRSYNHYQNANTVVVVESGTIAQQGTHEQLMDQPDGVYAKLGM